MKKVFTIFSIFDVRPERLKRFSVGLNEGIHPLLAIAPICLFSLLSIDVIVVDGSESELAWTFDKDHLFYKGLNFQGERKARLIEQKTHQGIVSPLDFASNMASRHSKIVKVLRNPMDRFERQAPRLPLLRFLASYGHSWKNSSMHQCFVFHLLNNNWLSKLNGFSRRCQLTIHVFRSSRKLGQRPVTC